MVPFFVLIPAVTACTAMYHFDGGALDSTKAGCLDFGKGFNFDTDLSDGMTVFADIQLKGKSGDLPLFDFASRHFATKGSVCLNQCAARKRRWMWKVQKANMTKCPHEGPSPNRFFAGCERSSFKGLIRNIRVWNSSARYTDDIGLAWGGVGI